jgi:hypothetical protein
MPPGWRRLSDKFAEASGRMWEKLAGYIKKGLSEFEFWKLTSVYQAWLPNMRHQCLWDEISVPLVAEDGIFEWRKIRELGELSIVAFGENSFELRDTNGCRVAPSPSMEEWEKLGEEGPHLHWHMNIAVLLMCSVQVRQNGTVLMPTHPTEPEDVLAQYVRRGPANMIDMVFLNYDGVANKGALAIEMPFPSANRQHPLAKVCHDSRYLREKSDIQDFATSFVPCVAQTVSSSGRRLSLEYWQKRVAHQYFTIDWKRYSNDLKAPYKIWTSKRGWTEIGEGDLVRWRDLAAV